MKNASLVSNPADLSYAEKLEVLFEIPGGLVAMMGHWNNDTGCVAGLADIEAI
jgi:hypothetical protein